jgi:hypothetical protein
MTSTQTSANSKKCNLNGEYNGKYEIKSWPPIEIGLNSSVDCPQGSGYAKWKCMDNYMFDNNGPDWSECDKWIDELHPIRSMFNASEVTEKIISNTEKNNSIMSYVKMAQVIAKVEDIQRFVNNQKDNSLNLAKSIAKQITRALSNILDQKYAWINSTVEQKINTSNEILINIQLTGFMVAHQQDEEHSIEIIRSKNIYLNTFFTNSREELLFPTNNTHKICSIIIPQGIKVETKNQTENNTAIGAVVYKIREYLLGGLTEHKIVNSEVLAFSMSEGFDTIQLNKAVKIRLKIC